MYKTISPIGADLAVPEKIEEDLQSFSPAETVSAVRSYLDNGFVVMRDVIPKQLCQRVNEALKQEIKPYKGLLPRIGGKEEVNRLNDNGFLANTLSNLQNSRIVPKSMSGYLAATLEVLTHGNLTQFHAAIIKSKICLLTWNHFEGNPVTIPHHDSFFWAQDMQIGEVVGAWIALEDIHPGAGRLYVFPGSHRSNLSDFARSSGRVGGSFNVAEDSYRSLVVEYLKSSDLECKAPSLRAGDVLFWDSNTIHGSLVTSEPNHSRSSFTAHYCSARGRFGPQKGQRQKSINGISVAFPQVWGKDAFRAKFPGLYSIARAIRR